MRRRYARPACRGDEIAVAKARTMVAANPIGKRSQKRRRMTALIVCKAAEAADGRWTEPPEILSKEVAHVHGFQRTVVLHQSADHALDDGEAPGAVAIGLDAFMAVWRRGHDVGAHRYCKRPHARLHHQRRQIEQKQRLGHRMLFPALEAAKAQEDNLLCGRNIEQRRDKTTEQMPTRRRPLSALPNALHSDVDACFVIRQCRRQRFEQRSVRGCAPNASVYRMTGVEHMIRTEQAVAEDAAVVSDRWVARGHRHHIDYICKSLQPTEMVERWSQQTMEARVVRYQDLKPCLNAFVDTRSPGSEAKENFTIIGPGVSENPAQHVHIAEAHGFNIGGARQPVGCVNSQHSHDTAEVFVVHSGEWRFDLGEHGDAAQVMCFPGDVISLPTGMFRGFTATAPAADGTPGFLWAVLGGDDPGRVLWAPKVFDMAARFGLVLLENGSLIDTTAGHGFPDGVAPMPRTSSEQVAALHVPSAAEAEALVWRPPVRTAEETSLPIIAPNAQLDWAHPFTLKLLINPQSTAIAPNAEVLFVHTGQLQVSWSAGVVTLNAGDTMTVPPGIERTITGTSAAYSVQAH